MVDGWKGGDTVNGRSSRVGVAKGHRRSRGQLVRRVKGFQDWEQVDRSRQDRHVPACFPAFPTRASLVSLDATGLVCRLDYQTIILANDHLAILLSQSATLRYSERLLTGSRIFVDKIKVSESSDNGLSLPSL